MTSFEQSSYQRPEHRQPPNLTYVQQWQPRPAFNRTDEVVLIIALVVAQIAISLLVSVVTS